MIRQQEPIALIGSGCRFPGESNSPSKLWDLLSRPRDVLSQIPQERFDSEGFYHPDGLHHGSSNVQHSYILAEDVRHFDASFFQIKPIEANSIDPQQRILLETVYESLESAGIPLNTLRGSDTAVYVGQMCADYNDILTRDTETMPTYFATGTSRAIMSNRVSYFFDWHGPSMTIDTACSSSLVAVHQAVQTLRNGDSKVAIAAGANLLLGPEPYIAESKLKMLSPDGRSRMWDDDANGYARGDGIASIVLKTLSAALEDGDHIECLIRETGINQDGRTKGITMPSNVAQAALIQNTYAKAGLDPSRKEDRPQYFEAHGTGTKAGDPQEAEAIYTAFFGNSRTDTPGEILHVGSIKTIIGHTEGTAGIAGLLKASLALRHSVIPPNMLFKHLNPAIKPFWSRLTIPTAQKKWPETADGNPRRASVNSFGFGGTNAHAILESYEPLATPMSKRTNPSEVFTPFVFSAASDSSLGAAFEAYAAYLKSNPGVDLRDLSWTLSSRRTMFPTRASFSSLTVGNLVKKLETGAQLIADKEKSPVVRSMGTSGGILGVFTGQGAQWATMGREIIVNSKLAENKIDELENTLMNLPDVDRPSWSLKKEMLSEVARVGDAELSQPLSTAVQILLVDCLRHAGVHFTAVVGHSSGEIGAAYASGFINAHAAICIAYYRGLHTKIAAGANGQQGAMLAVGTSMEDAQDICELPSFQGRIAVAASNSASSITMSGDLDAIQEAKEVFEEERKFVRALKVNKAYHSPHMLPCSEPYVKSMNNLDFAISNPSAGCTWFSSVHNGDKIEATNELKSTYWAQNMLQPVLFSQALRKALADSGPYNVVIEVGPHPALKGPAISTIEEFTESAIPYTGLLSRGKNDIEAFADALGFLWTHFNIPMDFKQFEVIMSGSSSPNLLKDLPVYSWHHDRLYWHESRAIESVLSRKNRPNELLGVRGPHETDQIQWRNFLRPSEMPWLKGHQIGGQMVFPAAGYVAMALEACKVVAGLDRDIKLIELENLSIGRPITFDDDNIGVEVIFTLANILTDPQNSDILTAHFTCHSPAGKESQSLAMTSSGKATITFGEPSECTLPSKSESTADMLNVDTERFYENLSDLGYGYSGPFKALDSLKRYLDLGTGLVSQLQHSDEHERLMVHPAMLDATFQSVFLAYSWPGDGRLSSLHVPTHIRSVKVNPVLCESNTNQGCQLPFETASEEDPAPSIHGYIDIFDKDGQNTLIQVENITVVPFSAAAPSDDRYLFSQEVWDVASPDGTIFVNEHRASEKETQLGTLIERVAYFYLKNFGVSLTSDEQALAEKQHPQLFNFMSKVFAQVASGTHPVLRTEWNEDTSEDIHAMTKSFPSSIDLNLMRVIGENMAAAVRGQTSIVDHMNENNLLETWLHTTLGLPEYTLYLARMAYQVAHRYPHMKAVEIGIGGSEVMSAVLGEIGSAFASYTYAGTSPEPFELAKLKCPAEASRLYFKPLDVEKDITEQGLGDNSYDLVILPQVFLNTSNLKQRMQNVRRLLKPGGFLLMLGMTNVESIRMDFIFGSLPEWFLEKGGGHELCSFASSKTWHTALRENGFSGVDSITPDLDKLSRPFSVIASQAVDDRINILRRPFSASPAEIEIHELVIVGGAELRTMRIVDEISEMMASRCSNITVVESLQQLTDVDISPMSTVLSLTELDEPVFKSLSGETFNNLKRLFDQSRNVLWVVSGAQSNEPYCRAMIGFGRTLQLEIPHVSLQFLDVIKSEVSGHRLAEALLRLQVSDQIEKDGAGAKFLWSTEPELLLKDGKFMIPRVKPNKAQNDRYNALRRSITTDVSPQSTIIVVKPKGTSYQLSEDFEHRHLQKEGHGRYVTIRVSHSLLSPLEIPSVGRIFVVIGINSTTGENVLALADTQASIVHVQRDRVIRCDIPSTMETRTIWSFATDVLAQRIVSQARQGETIVAHNPDPLSAVMLSERALEIGVSIFITTTDDDAQGSQKINFIHPHSSSRAIRAGLPIDTSVFVDFTPSLGSRIKESLPASCAKYSAASIFDGSSIAFFGEEAVDVSNLLTSGLMHSYSTTYEFNNSEDANIVTLGELSDLTGDTERSTVVRWLDSPSVPIRVTPAESQQLFHSDKSYLLIGLTGGLGKSLCEWMVSHGAKHIILTSRCPDVDYNWVKKLTAAGAVLKVIANDITSRSSVQELYTKVLSTCPPIAGVANGAMVLNDSSINDMTIEMMQKTLRPKIDGSRYLDELFQENTLDFFILFSSLTCACGNSGQSNYTAANMFMVGLAAQRKRKGLAASVIDIGAMMGVGVLVRDRSYALQKQLRDYGYLWMSERDFHHSFAEAVLAGRPESDQSPEVMAGIRLTRRDDVGATQWANNPRFSHCLLHVETDEGDGDSSNNKLSVRAQLAQASTEQELYKVLQDSFLAKMRTALSLRSDDGADPTAILAQSADDLGVDSLVAVDIRSWWLKEVDVDIPVLKILGGTPLGELIAFSLQKLLPELTIGLDTSKEASAPPSTSDLPKAQALESTIAPDSTSNSNSTTSSTSVTSPISTPTSLDENFKGIANTVEEISEKDFKLSKTESEKPSLAIQRREMMSYGQSRFWFLRMYLEDRTTFNIVCSIRLTGNVRVHDLAQAVKAVGGKHEALRTCVYSDEKGQHMQGILETAILHLEVKAIENENKVTEYFSAMRDYVFDLERGESMRIMLLSQNARSHHLLIGYHHINMDGISLQILLSDLEKAYSRKRLTSKTLQYADFAVRQRDAVSSGSIGSELAYWKQELADPPPPLPILSVSSITSRKPLNQYAHHRFDFKIASALGRRVKEASRQNKVTTFHFYLATFKVLLYRYAQANDLIIGIADGNRNDVDALESIGFFLNLLPLRLRSEEKQTFASALKEAHSKAYAALSNSRVPFDVLLEELNVPRSPSYNPIFQAFVNYRQGAQEKLPFGNCELEGETYEVGRTGYDISLDVIENAGGEASIMFLTQKDLYSQADTEILAKSFHELMDSFSRDTSLEIDLASLFTNEDIDQAVALSRGVSYHSTWTQTLVHRIDNMIEGNLHSPAVKDGEGSELTYAQMADRVSAISSALTDANVCAGDKIAVFQEPTTDWVCSLLAILRLGSIYVPLDLRSPMTRLRTIIQDCKPSVILVHAATLPSAPQLEGTTTRIVNVSGLSINQQHAPNLARLDSAAIILYTSGSTGAPKGVILSHSALANKIEDSSRRFEIKAPRVLQQSAFTFDFSVWQMFMALTTGGMLYMVPKVKRGDALALTRLVIEEDISHTVATPSEYIGWLRYGAGSADTLQKLAKSTWKNVFVGGEQASESLKQEFRTLDSPGLRLHNIFGPSEITIYSHTIEIDYRDMSTARVPVGYPAANYSAIIVDEHMKPVPTGVPGEILTAGAGIALGYLNNTELTKEKFIRDDLANPEYDARGWTTAFRTGDRGRIRPDGVLVFEGRIAGDTQIKLRGLRMELKDIEATIIKIADDMLEEAIVSVRGEDDSQYLVAHVVFRPDHHLISDAQKELFLKQLPSKLPLPQYMCPAVIVRLSSMPLNAHGKIDRLGIKALSIPEIINDNSAIPELSDNELRLKEIWEEILTKDVAKFYHIGPDTDFFHVGGNSLLLVKLQDRLKHEYETSLPLVQLFETSNLASMAARIQSNSGLNSITIDWDKETKLSADLKMPQDKIKPPIGEPKVVILTGSTGFLGKALLHHLIFDSNISKIHCVAVRIPARLSTLASAKIIIHKGDLTHPNFGLTAKTSAKIFDEATTIIHNGADVSFMKSYPTLQRANLQSTKALLALALPRRIPIHFISTASLVQYTCQPTVGPVSISAYKPPTDGSDGYAASKWASERFLERANAAFGVPVSIHRPSIITGDEAPVLDIMTNILRFSRLTRKVPASDRVTGWLDFVGVEKVAEGVLGEVVRGDGTDGLGAIGDGVRYFHQSGEVMLRVEELKQYLEKESGAVFKSVSTFGEWVKGALKMGIDPLVGEYIRGLDALKEPLVFPKLVGGLFGMEE